VGVQSTCSNVVTTDAQSDVATLVVGCCRLRLLPSALWESNRLVGCCYVGSRVRHDAPGALRGPFSYSEHVAAGGAFSGHLPFDAFCLSLLLSLSLVVFFLWWSRLIFTGRMNSWRYVLRSHRSLVANPCPVQKSTPVVVPVSTGLVPVVHNAWRLTPVIRILAGSTGLLFLL
jgi:hypothetical protein